MNNITEPARRPAGTPTGGQFAAAPHAESDVGLETPESDVDVDQAANAEESEVHRPTDQELVAQYFADLELHRDWIADYNSEGTFSFPPEPYDAMQVAAFWEHVQIPDVVLAQFRDAYPAARQRLLTKWVNHALADDPQPVEPLLGRTKKYQAALEAWQQRRAQKTAEMAEHVGPPTLAAHQVRPAVRAIMTARQLRELPEDLRVLVYGPSVHEWLTDERDAPYQNLELAEQFYAVSQMSESVFRDPSNEVSARLGELSSTMQQVHDELAAMRDGQELDIATRGARNQKEYAQLARAAGYQQI